eukprot:GHVL01021283.1.p1 GENE.GHVL01021283.1~~GHVL01021283.1.p1  ORF type:complete len:780 (+),score=176.02 GHVL01021283.1:53-2392(+)
MVARLRYTVLRCSSEDEDYPANELLVHSSQTRGWCSARFCDYPQELVVKFDSEVHLVQIQFLAHQSRIPTKIELFTSNPLLDSLNLSSLKNIKFSRLGYLSLDSNERSGFQARELKSVYVDVKATVLKVLLHKCHLNKYNLVNQVGLIALNCLGDSCANLTQEAALPSAESARISENDNTQNMADEVNYDSLTAERLRSLNDAKTKAVAAEDFDEAKKIKEMINKLRSIAASLTALEKKKRLAVENEDFDAAKVIKQEIDRLRLSITSGGPPPPSAQNTDQKSPPITQRRNSVEKSEDIAVMDDERPISGGPPPLSDEEGDQSGDTLKSPGEDMPIGGGMTAPTVLPPPVHVAAPRFAPGKHPLQGVPDCTELPGAEEIPTALQKEADPLQVAFGDYLVKCLFSKSWYLRDAAAQKLAMDAAAGKFDDSIRNLLPSLTAIVKRLSVDKIAQVFLSSQALLQTIADKILSQPEAHHVSLKKAEVQAMMEPLMPSLVERLGDPNRRCQEAAAASIHALAASPLIGGAFLGYYILKNPKKQKPPAKLLVARLQLLQQMVKELHVIQPLKKDGMTSESIMRQAMEWFNNATADVRNACVALTGTIYALLGEKHVDPYMTHLRKGQRELFDLEFERVTENSPPSPPPPQIVKDVPLKKGKSAVKEDDRKPAKTKPIEEPAALSRSSVEEDGDDDSPPFTCGFCNRHDERFTPQGLDMHYWKDCPVLLQCPHCQQIIEIIALTDHLLDECDGSDNYRRCEKSIKTYIFRLIYIYKKLFIYIILYI